MVLIESHYVYEQQQQKAMNATLTSSETTPTSPASSNVNREDVAFAGFETTNERDVNDDEKEYHINNQQSTII